MDRDKKKNKKGPRCRKRAVHLGLPSAEQKIKIIEVQRCNRAPALSCQECIPPFFSKKEYKYLF
jgi:hypothetical protein